MDFISKLISPLFYTLLLSLFVGLFSTQTDFGGKPLLWGFVLLMLARWSVESLHPSVESFRARYGQSEHARWLVWIAGLSFLTNLVLPIADYRYRHEWAWTSPFARDPWWSWFGLLFLAAGVGLRIWAIQKYVPHKSEPAPSAKRKTKKESDTAQEIALKNEENRFFNFFDLGAVIAYLGIALICSSLWALLFWAILILPATLYRMHKARLVMAQAAEKVMA